MYSALLLFGPWLLWPLLMLHFFSGSVTCNNNSGDYSLVQTALTGGGTVSLSGTCLIGTNQLNIPSNTTFTSTNPASMATISYTGTDQAAFLAASGTNITISYLIFSGGGIYMHRTGINNIATNITLDHLTIHNITSGKNGFTTEAIMRNSTISNSTFQNIGAGGWGPPPNGGNPGNPCPGTGCGDYNGGAIRAISGFDSVTIENNTFDEILNDAIAADNDLCLDNTSTVASCSNNKIIYNHFTNIYRIAVEWQSVAGTCPNGCNYSRQSTITLNNYFEGNTYHNISRGYYQTWFLSNIPGKGTYYLNNTCVLDSSGLGSGTPGASCFEVSNMPGNTIVQGNVTATSTSVSGSLKWAYTVATPSSGTTQTVQNNIHCGPLMQFQHTETGGSGGTLIVQNNYNNYPSGCPTNASAPFTSSITPAWSAGNPTNFPIGGNGTWNMTAISNLSLREVDFYVDSVLGSPVAAPDVSDFSSTFQTDRKWPYHATFNTSAFGTGTHTLYAVVRDVNNVTATISTTFTVGSGPTSSSIQPDWFTGTALKSFWAPTTNANETITVSGNELRMSLAGGTNNDAFVGGNNAVRIMQSIPSGTDFKIYLRIDGIPVTQKYNGVGIMVIQDSGTYLRNEVAYGMGTSNVYQLASDIVSGGSQTVTNNISFGASISTPFYLLLQRSGTTYTLSYSSDGVNFTASTPYTSSLTESLVGVYAWNYNSTVSLSPAYTAQVKYFNPQIGVSISPSSTAIFGNTSITGSITLN